MGLFKKKPAADRLYDIDQKIQRFSDRKKSLSDRDHRKLQKMLDNRADAMSEVLGVKVYSLSGDGFRKTKKKYR